GAGLIPMLSYGYLYVRAKHPGAASVWPALEPTLRGVRDHVLATVYRGFLGAWHPDTEETAYLTHDIYPFLWPGLLALAVWIVVARRACSRIVLAAILGASILQLVFAYHYGVADPCCARTTRGSGSGGSTVSIRSRTTAPSTRASSS